LRKKSLGICIGASTIAAVFSSGNNGEIAVDGVKLIVHEGNPKLALGNYLSGMDLSDYSVVVTGRKFRSLLKAHTISEPKAVENSIDYLNLAGVKFSIASLGAENFIVYCVSEKGRIETVLTGNKCASGTGEFFLQQIRRMDLSVEEAVELSNNDNAHFVSGRCSVFCKSDCTHALNKGVNIGSVVSGLSKMIADKTVELLSKQKQSRVVLIGGVSKNKSVVDFIRNKYTDLTIPAEASYFEALGAALEGLKYHYTFDGNNIFKQHTNQYSTLEALSSANAKVSFKSLSKDSAKTGDVCVLGLDVGSTTTKAVIIRKSDSALLASVYLRTNGNPVQASVNCYKELQSQIHAGIKITGLGVTGSGRHVSSLHALTKGDINEIIAHAVAAAHFDSEVDTIFEIGGQDAKYTFLTNGIASDYAMNEACSAGTGSFLEEAAKETLNIDYKSIADIAFEAAKPINFNDQCAAFISSDIKNASHDGGGREDIVAGLVYSICMNYVNRVKGNRPVGKKIFMQGGVCYNKAVPYAMSLLINKEIIVPPEPGLMGAFGVALEIINRISLGLYEETEFRLDELINREFRYGNEFICAGGKEKCDRKCGISMIEVDGKKYPFGGACNKYYNERFNIRSDPGRNNLVKIRQDLVFNKYCIVPPAKGKRVGITKSLLSNTLYPLYYNFFSGLGCEVVLADNVDSGGYEKIRSSYCYPAEVSHGLFQDLIKKDVEYIFLPHITQMESKSEFKYNRLCVFVQGETYFLRSAFRDELENEKGKLVFNILSPVIDLSSGRENVRKVFEDISKEIGFSKSEGRRSFNFAYDTYKKMLAEFKELGRQALEELESTPGRFAVALFGRSYNAFAGEVNLNIPHKLASKDIMVIPHDFLPSEEYASYENMYWYTGHQILASARFIKDHEQLYGVFITNFSCGPDSFIIPYFRKIMGTKPSLTLELDSHSADVGVDTRIDAAMDIIRNYIELRNMGQLKEKVDVRKHLRVVTEDKHITIIDAKGNKSNIKSENLDVLIPSMGRFSTDAFSAIFRSFGINSRPLPVPTFETLKYGRNVTTCKECLPFLLTSGSLIEYVRENKDKGRKILFFMTYGYGPCRQGQYIIRLKDIIDGLDFEDVGIISMDDESSFDDFGSEFFTKQWAAIIIADVIHDIENAIMVLAVDRDAGLALLEQEWKNILSSLESGNLDAIYKRLKLSAAALSTIKLKQPLHSAKTVSMIGEIYVRREEFSRIDLMKTLIDHEFVVKAAPITEYVYYTNYLQKQGIVGGLNLKEKAKIFLKDRMQIIIERKIKKILSSSGLCHDGLVDIDKTIKFGKDLISEKLIGESILTTGLALRDIIDEACGVISIGPFNCIPSRLAEAILSKEMTLEGKYRFGHIKRNGYPKNISDLPYLHVESDGNAFPQITQSRIEIFIMQAERLHKEMRVKC